MSLPALTGGPDGYGKYYGFVVTSVYGTNASNSVTYGLGQVTVGASITASEWNTLIGTIDSERSRRGYGSAGISISNPINHSTFNAMASAIAVAGPGSSQAYNSNGTVTVITYPQAGAISTTSQITAGSLIYANNVNALINDINNSGAVCTCNCNYCTCNCNYCTCNCNYSCTCNCNYVSDIRLKTNIKQLGTRSGLKVYSFSYLDNIAKTFIGVMAQDLIGTEYEKALVIREDGYYTVNYGMLPFTMIEE